MSTTVGRAFELTDRWRMWIAENFLLGVGDQTILDVLVAQGVSQAQAQAEFQAAREDVYMEAAGWITQRMRKLESTLDALQRMRQLDPAHSGIPRHAGLSRERFLADYYASNRPTILTDVADNWPAVQVWTPGYLKDAAGAEMVEVMAERENDEEYEVNSDAHRQAMRFGDYVNLVTHSGPTNDFYLVANNHFLDKTGTAALWADFSCDERFLDPAAASGRVFFWFGPAGTITPLHHDVSNILLVQVRGTKRITLVPALESHLVYNDVGVFSQVNAEFPNAQRHPRFSTATRLTVDLRESEALFIPVGWWHHVRSLEMCISLSFTNFAFPNHFDWSFPNIVR
jgi:ribosomal protein L16 Arg81 hydroxylase